MKLTLFGATGRTGKYVLDQALARGHIVAALVRNGDDVETVHPDLTLLQGDAMKAGDVHQAIAGARAVISTLGPTRGGPPDMMARSAENIVNAMNLLGARRLVLTTGAGVPAPEDSPNMMNRVMGLLLNVLARRVYADSLEAVERVVASDLDWTIARGPMLLDAAYNGNYKAGYIGEGMSGRLSRGNFADFILNQLETDAYLHKMPVVSDT